MSKMIDTDKLAKLAKNLDDRAAAKVKLEEDRAVAAENALQESISTKQDATDNTLNTEDKTIVGAINELDSEVFDIAANVISLDTYKADKSYVDEQINGINNVEVVSVPIVDSVLSLTLDKYQKTNMISGTTIKFPTVTKFTEIHLYFDAEIDIELNFPECKWRVEPNIEAGKSYEVVCTYNTINWLVNVMVYS